MTKLWKSEETSEDRDNEQTRSRRGKMETEERRKHECVKSERLVGLLAG